jgi:hypothetical protein
VTLGDATNGVSAADRALAHYDLRETTEPALVRFERASALLQSGDLDEACRFAAGTVLDPRTYHSVTVRTRARKFDALIGNRRSPAIQEWRAVMRESYSTPLPSPSISAGEVHLPFPRHG